MGIAGGRPSSSYYFVGSQADNLFYLDPHHARPAVPLRSPPPINESGGWGPIPILREEGVGEEQATTGEREKKKRTLVRKKKNRVASGSGASSSTSTSPPKSYRIPTSPAASSSTASSAASHAPMSPSPLQRELSSESSSSPRFLGGGGRSTRAVGEGEGDEDEVEVVYSPVSPSTGGDDDNEEGGGGEQTPQARVQHSHQTTQPIPISVALSQSSTTSNVTTSSTGTSGGGNQAGGGGGPGSNSTGTEGLLDLFQQHYVTSYSASELKTYHCERVRKMPLSGLDPSMLLGFLCRDLSEWVDLRKRIEEVSLTFEFFDFLFFSCQEKANFYYVFI